MSRDEYITLRMQKAKESLKVASSMIEDQYYSFAVNRIYYAVFYAVSALVYTKKLYPKSHTGLKILFNREFILPGLIKHEYEKFYSAIFAKRMEADYADLFEISSENAKQYYNEAENFVSLIEQMINNTPEK